MDPTKYRDGNCNLGKEMLALIFPLIEIVFRFEIRLNEYDKCRVEIFTLFVEREKGKNGKGS